MFETHGGWMSVHVHACITNVLSTPRWPSWHDSTMVYEYALYGTSIRTIILGKRGYIDSAVVPPREE